MKKYVTTTWSTVRAEIKEVEVEKETGASVWIGGRRLAKNTSYEQYHDTWERAHAHLMSKAKYRVESCRHDLELANSALGNVKGMKPPK